MKKDDIMHDFLRKYVRNQIKSTEVELFTEDLRAAFLAIDGLLTDGGHHKQWFLEQILITLGFDLAKLREMILEPDENGDYWDWEEGIAP